MRRRLQLALLVAVATATFSSAVVLSRAAPDTHLGRTLRGSILFSNSVAIYRRDPGGALTTVIHATGAEADLYPVWSRAGTHIAFERFRGKSFPGEPCQLMVMNSDGSNVRRIGRVETDCSGASWGPNDRRLVFGGGAPMSNGPTLQVVNADGTGLRTLFGGKYANDEDGTHPSWSPDGRTIAFAWEAGGPLHGLLAIHPDGSHLHALVKPRTRKGDVLAWPTWSRDGRHLAYLRDSSLDLESAVIVATSRGLRRHVLARMPKPGVAVYILGGWGGSSWSPNDSLLVFSGPCLGGDGRWNVCVWTIPSGGGKRQLLMPGAWGQPSWKPAGR